MEIISVRFKEGGKCYHFDPDGQQYKEEDLVVVETSRCAEIGTVAQSNTEIDDKRLHQPVRKVLRRATDEDIRVAGQNKAKEAEAMSVCQQQIERHRLDMKLIDVEYSFDGTKILFYFTSDGRVDFRDLVKDLAGIFRTRIELRQIGVRDEARMLGGLGICGRAFCCSTFLGEFHPVSIKMAKEQMLPVNPVKISGTCGRLMCCLKYEQDAYEDMIKRSPHVGQAVRTPDGPGVVSDVFLLKSQIKVQLDKQDMPPKIYKNDEIKPIRGQYKVVEKTEASPEEDK